VTATRRRIHRPPWWDGAVIYHCYPRSFADSNGDGIGDLAGITERLDYLTGSGDSLGVDAVWLSPIYPHGGADGGYDIVDHAAIAPEFGNVPDFDRFLAAAHERNLRVLLDLVVGHVSIGHPWFVEARSGRAARRRDWFIWADPKPDGGPPNNWVAVFGGPAWTFDYDTGQYYHHTYYPEQPDLNWRNPEVQGAVADILRFWLARGIDGFRVDAAQNLIKDARLRDNPPTRGPRRPFPPEPGGLARRWNANLPGARRVLRGFRAVTDEYPGTFLLGEIYSPPDRLASYLHAGEGEGLHAALDMELGLSEWSAPEFTRAIRRAERHLFHPLFPTWNLSNHDLSRQATRWGLQQSRLAALIMLTLRGMICLYQGEEIGMTDHPQPPQPPLDRWGRDAFRTPMQWSAGPNGGFTPGVPWLPLNDPDRINVEDQVNDPQSMLSLHRRLIDLRRKSQALRHGSLSLHARQESGVIAYERLADRERILVVANMSEKVKPVRIVTGRGRVLVSTSGRSGHVQVERMDLQGLEGLVLRMA
jgi:alpha-glucosidase